MPVTGQVSFLNAVSSYGICDIDTATPSYYGFINKIGKWYIIKEESNTYRYSSGISNYPTAWSSRSSIGYDYFNNVIIE